MRFKSNCDFISFHFITSHLDNRTQSVAIGCSSENLRLTCGVLHGSVLEPVLFTLYTVPLHDIIHSYNLECMIYADDTQIYLIFDSSEREEVIRNTESCVVDTKAWMTTNKLKLNESKT